MTPTHTLQQLDKDHVWHPFTHMFLWLNDDPLVITHGQGVYLFDADGTGYLDGTSSLWCNLHGHRVQEIDEAIRQQLDKVAHTTLLGLTNEPAVVLAKKLVDIAPPGLTKVFYSDSGATATEVAFKLAVQYWWNIGRAEKTAFIALTDAYHGDTVGAMSVGTTPAFHKPYQALLFKVYSAEWKKLPRKTPPGQHPMPGGICDSVFCTCAALHNIEVLLIQHARTIAAVCIEPMVMGAAGMIVQSPVFVKGVRELCDKYDVLMIADEVATGFGRTGRMFAVNHADITPDFLCLGKGLTGGYLPVAATLTTQRIFDAFSGQPHEGKTFFHGHTFTGNPLGCAAAIASLELFNTNNLLQYVQQSSEAFSQMLDTLKTLPNVSEVRQMGLMAGVELVARRNPDRPFDPRRRMGAEICRRMRDEHHVILRPLGDTIVINPPLVTTPQQLQIIVDALRTVLLDIKETTFVTQRSDEQIAGDF
jgi:adenosylmethionine---8-amino-7-oxononanoate aminotransferase